MLDFSHFPTSTKVDVQTFIGNQSAVGNGGSQTWVKPRGVGMVSIFLVGQGGKGAPGVIGATSTGGSGGGSGAQSSWTGPAWAVPDVLHFSGGAGQANAAIPTLLTTRPTVASPAVSDIALWAGGANAGTAGPIGTIAGGILAGAGISFYLVGQTGGTAGAITPTAGGNITALTTGLMVMGGAGGGGMSAAAATAGGSVTPSFPSWCPPATAAAAGTSGVAGGRGNNGICHFMQRHIPFVSTGGAGGGSGFPTATISDGGSGGSGGYGSGGGGGGGAVTGAVVGVGGNGGPGLCIIASW